jgi:hypothetical protein
MKALNRMALFGAMPPSILPALVSVRTKVDLPKTADRKLLRLVNYMIQIAAGEGSAGTVVPFSTLLGEQHAAALRLVVSCTLWGNARVPAQGQDAARSLMRM